MDKGELDPLRRVDHLDVRSLSASDVRRLGESRRRRHALRAAAVAAAVAAVATGTFYLTSRPADEGARPAVVDTPSPTDPQMTPEILPINEDMLLTLDTLARDTRLDSLEQVTDQEGPILDCQAEPLAALRPERAGFRGWRGAGTEAATGVLEFADEQSARTAYRLVSDWVSMCRDRLPGARDLRDTSAGGGSFLGEAPFTEGIFSAADPSGGTWFDHQYAGLVGSRVVLLSVATLTAKDFDPLRGTSDALRDALDQARIPSGTRTGEEIPADFPLVEGFPDDSQAESPADGRRGPSRRLAPLTLSLCGTTAPDPQHTDRLLASWSNPEDGRYRQLTTYTDADAAMAAMRDLVRAHQDCPEEPANDGITLHHEVTRSAVGGESWAFVSWYEYEGSPTIGRNIVHLIRVGRAILLDTTVNEGMGGPGQEDQVKAAVDAQIDATAEAVAAMCLFTVAGCGG